MNPIATAPPPPVPPPVRSTPAADAEGVVRRSWPATLALNALISLALAVAWSVLTSVLFVFNLGVASPIAFQANFGTIHFSFLVLFAGLAFLVTPRAAARLAQTLDHVILLAYVLAALAVSIVLTLVTGTIMAIFSPAGPLAGLASAARAWVFLFIAGLILLALLARPSRLSVSRKRKVIEAMAGYLFLLPNITGFLVFTFLPILASLALSFCKWDIISGFGNIRFVGLRNFRRLLGIEWIGGTASSLSDVLSNLSANDPYFWKYLWNTLVFMLGIPFGIAGSLLLAILLNRKIRGRVIFRTVYFLPSMCVPVAIFLMWRWLYNPEFGLINWLLSWVGIQGPDWLASTTWAKPALIISGIWAGVGGPNMILYLAGLQGIPRDLYEAADIDGANPFQKFRKITWPLLSPTTFFIFIMSVIGGFQGNFEGAYMMTRGGPAGSTTAISYYIYNNAFRWFKMGYAASIAWILFLIILVMTLVNYRYGGRRVHYY